MERQVFAPAVYPMASGWWDYAGEAHALTVVVEPQAVAHEIDAFKAEYRLRNPGADVDKVTDEELEFHIREAWRLIAPKKLQAEEVP